MYVFENVQYLCMRTWRLRLLLKLSWHRSLSLSIETQDLHLIRLVGMFNLVKYISRWYDIMTRKYSAYSYIVSGQGVSCGRIQSIPYLPVLEIYLSAGENNERDHGGGLNLYR